MRKYFFGILLFLFSFFVFTSPVSATENPTKVANNKFGIHVIDANKFSDAATLVNSSGGDWGYVTIVIQKNDRNHSKWQNTFNELRRLHLIPIVRIATQPLGDIWEKPSFDEINGWVDFLNSLNWVVKNRYVIISNEPNHSKEWGGEINPEEYATYLKTFSQKLKDKNQDFFVLSAGLDASAPNSKETMDETLFLKRMLQKEPDLFSFIDGLNSHSYPNPGFTGSPYAIGRKSIKTYEWEIYYLKTLGIEKDLPVFITETGWVHNMGAKKDKRPSENQISAYYKYAFESVWNNPKVVAVTPFILSYSGNPFAEFSWQKENGEYYEFYKAVKDLKKIKGEPTQIESASILSLLIQPFVPSNDKIIGSIIVKNTGQSIWYKDQLKVKIVSNDVEIEVTGVHYNIEPGQIGIINLSTNYHSNKTIESWKLNLYSKNELISNEFPFRTFSVQSIKVRISEIFDKIVEEIKGP